jgi:hypothetical protein
MVKAPSAAQRRAVAGSDAATGRLSARPDVCTALVAAGLAVPHGRGGHHSYYLTTDGLRLRAELAGAASGEPAEADPVPQPAAAFTADDGTGEEEPAGGAARRAAQVATAWEGLLQIRAVLLDGVTDVPAPWERERCVHAVSLALEATGCPPARPGSPGYRVTPATEPGMAHVAWSDPASAAPAVAECAHLLAERGWQPTEHRTRDGNPYLVVSPRR